MILSENVDDAAGGAGGPLGPPGAERAGGTDT